MGIKKKTVRNIIAGAAFTAGVVVLTIDNMKDGCHQVFKALDENGWKLVDPNGDIVTIGDLDATYKLPNPFKKKA